MVSIPKVDFNLNHHYQLNGHNPAIGVGAITATATEELELFAKSLALASDLKRLPILRSIDVSTYFAPTLIADMVVSGVNRVSIIATLYNCDEDAISDEDIIGVYTAGLTIGTGATNFYTSNRSNLKGGGYLLRNKVTLQVVAATDIAVSTSTLAAFLIGIYLGLEIDWAEVTKAQFEEYVLESVYAKD